MGKKFKFKINKKLAAWIGVLLLLIGATGAGMLVWWLQNKGGGNQTPNGAAAFDPVKEKLPAAVDKAQSTALSGNVNQSNQELQTALAQPSVNNDDKYQLYLQLGVNYSNQNDHQKALDALKQADAAKSTYTTSHLIAEQYEALGDKQSAIAYYKKTITQLDTKSPGYASDKQDYENRITALGGQP